MKKRGQITIFIILGVIIAFSAVVIIYLKSLDIETDINAPVDSGEISESFDFYVRTCLKTV